MIRPLLALNTVLGSFPTTYVQHTAYDAAGRVRDRGFGPNGAVVAHYHFNLWSTQGGRLLPLLSIPPRLAKQLPSSVRTIVPCLAGPPCLIFDLPSFLLAPACQIPPAFRAFRGLSRPLYSAAFVIQDFVIQTFVFHPLHIRLHLRSNLPILYGN